MKIDFSKEQFAVLMKLCYLGNWVVNAIRTDDHIKEFDDLEQYIYSFANEFGVEGFVEYDKKFKKYFPTADVEEDSDLRDYLEDYDDENFWEELTFRLGERDFFRHYGATSIAQMSPKECYEKRAKFTEKYGNEFETNGIERLEITDVPNGAQLRSTAP